MGAGGDDFSWAADPLRRAAAVAALALVDPPEPDNGPRLEAALRDPDPRVRVAACGALARLTPADVDLRSLWERACSDSHASVRRRAAEVAPAVAASGRMRPAARLVAALDDPAVAETAAWALGELGDDARAVGATASLALVAVEHDDSLVREAAVAALGSLGDVSGLPAILTACRDRPAVRRRAVLALAAFEGPEVDAALKAARSDRDWQTRQAAEDLMR